MFRRRSILNCKRSTYYAPIQSLSSSIEAAGRPQSSSNMSSIASNRRACLHSASRLHEIFVWHGTTYLWAPTVGRYQNPRPTRLIDR